MILLHTQAGLVCSGIVPGGRTTTIYIPAEDRSLLRRLVLNQLARERRRRRSRAGR
jgi:hypothetical protein